MSCLIIKGKLLLLLLNFLIFLIRSVFRPVILEVPHFAALRGAEREITVLRSENGQSWREHSDLATLDSIQNTLCGSFEGEGD